MMVGFILTSVLLLVLPSLVCGTTTTINVTDSGSLQLSSFPDELTISDSLDVTCTLTGRGVSLDKVPELRLNIAVTENLLTPLYEDRIMGYDPESKSLTKSVPVTFSSSSQMPLQEQAILVTVSTSFYNIPVEVMSHITDNRVEIGFLAEIRTCYPKKVCDLAVKINHSTDAFNITIDLNDSEGKSVYQTTFPVDDDNIYHPTVTPPEQGIFTAALSVADKNIESRVYWSKRTSYVDVVANITELENVVTNLENMVNDLITSNQNLWNMYQNLSKKYDKLVDSLPTTPPVVDDSCNKKDCGDHGECVQGKCNCTYPYGGEDCNDYIPCQSDPCGSRGACQEPGNNTDTESDYECQCYNGNVFGPSCTDCEGYCNEPNGVCSVDDAGKPYCTCNESYTGDSCEFKKCNSSNCGEKMVCNGGYCVCQDGYTGEDCHAICSDKPCENGGKCHSIPNTDGYKCNCQPGYSEINCTIHVCSKNPCQKDEVCKPDSNLEGYKCICQNGKDCVTTPSPVPTTESSEGVVPTPVYQQPAVWAIAIFIVVLVICVLAYIGYHNRNKILELLGGKKESVVEMAMRSRRKTKGYKKLPTSIHDTLTHED